MLLGEMEDAASLSGDIFIVEPRAAMGYGLAPRCRAFVCGGDL